MNLVTSGDQVDVEFLGEVIDDVLVKYKTDSSFALHVVLVLTLFWVRPQKVTKQSLVRNVCWALDHFDVSVII